MPASKPRVGIFMPAYNQGRYINEALDSLKNQTFQDFEVAIVDDASNDKETIPILQKINYDKARVYLHKANQGVGKLARNYYKKLGNEYIFVLCADDKIHPDFIKECVIYLDTNPRKAAVGTFIQKFGDDNTLIPLYTDKVKLPEMLMNNNYLGSSMMRFEALKEIDFGNRQKVFQKHNDYDRWVSMLENGWGLGIIEKPLFYYRIHNSSLSKSINIADEISFRKAFIQKHRTLFEKYVDYIVTDSLTQLYSNQNWQKELKEGRDWLDVEYNKLLKEREKLCLENADLRSQLNYRPVAAILALKSFVKKLCPPKTIK